MSKNKEQIYSNKIGANNFRSSSEAKSDVVTSTLSRYTKRHLKEKKEFENEKREIFRHLLQYHYISLQLMIESNLYRGSDLKSVYDIDSSNLYLVALKYQKKRLFLK